VYKTFIVVVPWQGKVYSWEKGAFAMQSVDRRKRKEERIGDSRPPNEKRKDLYL
jgi:hypothetical protein